MSELTTLETSRIEFQESPVDPANVPRAARARLLGPVFDQYGFVVDRTTSAPTFSKLFYPQHLSDGRHTTDLKVLVTD